MSLLNVSTLPCRGGISAWYESPTFTCLQRHRWKLCFFFFYWVTISVKYAYIFFFFFSFLTQLKTLIKHRYQSMLLLNKNWTLELKRDMMGELKEWEGERKLDKTERGNEIINDRERYRWTNYCNRGRQ